MKNKWRMPHPATMFLLLTMAVVFLSWICDIYGLKVTLPQTGEDIRVQSLLSPEGIRWWLRNAIKNFTGFAPLGMVIIAMFGLGVAQHSGFIDACIRMGVLYWVCFSDFLPWRLFMTKQRILFITTGGTIASVHTPQGLRPVLSSDELLAHLPELNDLCIPETLALCSIDSTDLGQEHWLMMARAIQENYALYDGFIICHGTDTLAYSAAALSYLIQNADKPIILTGAQQPISNEITDAKKNLRDSVICALDPGSRGVMVVFGGHVIAGTRAKKNKTISYDAFASVNFPELALVQGDRLVRYVPSPWPTGPVEFGRAMNPRVFLLKLIPGMDPGMIPEIFRLYDCVIVESFGVGGIPQRLMDAFAEGLGHYEQTHKVLILTTQVTYEGSDVGVYEVGKRVKNRFRFLEAHDMTIEAVVTKSMWLLAQDCDSFDQLQQRFYRQVNFDTFYH